MEAGQGFKYRLPTDFILSEEDLKPQIRVDGDADSYIQCRFVPQQVSRAIKNRPFQGVVTDQTQKLYMQCQSDIEPYSQCQPDKMGKAAHEVRKIKFRVVQAIINVIKEHAQREANDVLKCCWKPLKNPHPHHLIELTPRSLCILTIAILRGLEHWDEHHEEQALELESCVERMKDPNKCRAACEESRVIVLSIPRVELDDLARSYFGTETYEGYMKVQVDNQDRMDVRNLCHDIQELVGEHAYRAAKEQAVKACAGQNKMLSRIIGQVISNSPPGELREKVKRRVADFMNARDAKRPKQQSEAPKARKRHCEDVTTSGHGGPKKVPKVEREQDPNKELTADDRLALQNLHAFVKEENKNKREEEKVNFPRSKSQMRRLVRRWSRKHHPDKVRRDASAATLEPEQMAQMDAAATLEMAQMNTFCDKHIQ